MVRKPGVKPKGKRALSKAEQQQRVRARLRIINEELGKVGLKAVSIYMPPIYMEALRAYEAGLQARPNMVEAVAKSSGWLCLAVEEFIREAAEAAPDSEVARIFNGDEWVSSDSLPFETAAQNAMLEIYRFEQQHERELK